MLPAKLEKLRLPKMNRFWQLACLVFLSTGLLVLGEKEVKYVPEDVVHPSLRELKAPQFYEGVTGVVMPVVTSSDLAKKHFLEGVGLMNSAWDYEAYRHFCAAIQEDPECLMAYWGAALTLGGGLPEFAKELEAASAMMVQLMQAKMEGEEEEFVFPQYERDHVAAAGVLLTRGPLAARPLYVTLSSRYSNDLQAALMMALVHKEGYDEGGDAEAAQAVAEGVLNQLLEENPQNDSVMMASLLVKAEVPNEDDRVRKELVPLARKLVEQSGGFGPHLNALAFLEWRAGNMPASEAAAAKGMNFFFDYISTNQVQVVDCDKFFIAGIQRAVSQACQGKQAEALKSAAELAAINVPVKRVQAPGAIVALWDARTLAARLVLKENSQTVGQKALDLLPRPADVKPFSGESLVPHFYQCVANYCELRKSVDEQDLDRAKVLDRGFPKIVEQLGNKRESALRTGTFVEWFNALKAVGVWSFEGKGELAMAQKGDRRGSALNWYAGANDRQTVTRGMRTPYILYPLELREAEFYFSQKDYTKCEEKLREGLVEFPNDLQSLELYERCLRMLGRADEAKTVKRQIQLVTGG